ncbi:MAG TPA: hypothetical protein VMC09_14870 [Anaerolineales bacterium]|nr:hypothetical protein [Anaerolineales bacterium]
MTKRIPILLLAGSLLALMLACVVPVEPVMTVTAVPPTEASIPPTATPPPVPVQGLNQIQMIDQANGWAWAGKPDGTSMLLRTADGGSTWADVTPQNLPGPSAGFFLDAQTAWVQTFDSATNASGLGMTTDGGRTWTAVNQSLPFVSSFFHFYNKTDGYAEIYDVGAGQATVGFYETHDSGANWDQIMLASPPEDVVPGFLHTCNICGDDVYYDPTRLIVVFGDMANDPAGSVRLQVSADLGKTWKKLVLPLPAAKYADGLIGPGDPVFFDDRNGLLPFVIVKFNQDGTKAYSDQFVYSTQDGGLTWKSNSTAVANVDWMSRVDFATSRDAFVACGNALCASHDGTVTWQALTSNLNFAYADGTVYVSHFQFIDSSQGWAITTDGTNYNLWKTTDGGQTWTELSPSLIP